MHEKYVVIAQQKRLNEKEDWTTKDHCMFAKKFVDFIAQLPGKSQLTSGGYITSGHIVPPLTPSDPLHADNLSNLTVGTREIFFKYNCYCFPVFENQLGVSHECET